MAQRRMFSKRITNSARFLKMPISSQALYFHLSMHADDDGIVEAYTVLKFINSSEDDLRVLVTKEFVKILNNDDLIAHIIDWKEHNLIRADRKVDSIYKHLLLQVQPDIKLIESKERADTKTKTKRHNDNGRPMDNQRTAQVRLVKDRIGKVSLNNIPDKSESTQLINIYNSLLKDNNIIQISEKHDYIQNANKCKKYIAVGMDFEIIKEYMQRWFSEKIGDWCGYKLSGFWNDIGKMQINKKQKKYETHDEMLKRVHKEMEELDAKHETFGNDNFIISQQRKSNIGNNAQILDNTSKKF